MSNKLYFNGLSPNSKRVRVIGNELGVNFESISLDFATGANKKPEFLAKNPNGKVPVVEFDDGYTLWESPAILFYFANKYPNAKLWPTDLRAQTDVFRWTAWNASHFEPAINAVATEKLIKPMFNQPADDSRIKWGQDQWERFTPVFNTWLEGKNYVCGENYTFADICIGTNIEVSLACGFDYAKYPYVKTWWNRVSERDAWKKSTT